MVFLTVCRKIADSTLLLGLMFGALILVFGIHSRIIAPLGEFEDGLNVPDARMFGYTVEELNLWYDRVGVEGCEIYILGADWDFVPIMIVYPFFLGSMLIKFTRAAGWSESLAYIPLMTVVFDIEETYLQREGCVVFPERLSDEHIVLAGNCCRMKWMGLNASMLLILGLFVKERLFPNPGVDKKGD